MKWSTPFHFLFFALTTKSLVAEEICISSSGNYTVVLDMYGGELGMLHLSSYEGRVGYSVAAEHVHQRILSCISILPGFSLIYLL